MHALTMSVPECCVHDVMRPDGLERRTVDRLSNRTTVDTRLDVPKVVG